MKTKKQIQGTQTHTNSLIRVTVCKITLSQDYKADHSYPRLQDSSITHWISY